MKVRITDAERRWLDDHNWLIIVDRGASRMLPYFWRASYIPFGLPGGPPPSFRPIPFEVSGVAQTRGGAYRAALRWLRSEARRRMAMREAVSG